VEAKIRAFGLEPNRQKTHVVPPGARKVLLGLLVGGDRPRLTRQFRNNLETHIYALTNRQIGPLAHLKRRGFESVIGMRRHIHGLLTFAMHVDPNYARPLLAQFREVAWPV
jgi:RNA-directed DNA polymerase